MASTLPEAWKFLFKEAPDAVVDPLTMILRVVLDVDIPCCATLFGA